VAVVQRVARERVGAVSTTNNSALNAISISMMPYVRECLRRLGKDPYLCEICDESQAKPCQIHHTKYDGATIYDLQYVCPSCNLARVNRGLS
jgi:hypothetical protein